MMKLYLLISVPTGLALAALVLSIHALLSAMPMLCGIVLVCLLALLICADIGEWKSLGSERKIRERNMNKMLRYFKTQEFKSSSIGSQNWKYN